MKILIAGICGFVGRALAQKLPELLPGLHISGIDNFLRQGAHYNRDLLLLKNIDVRFGDIRNNADLENLPDADWVIDAAACPSVMAGLDEKISSRQLMDHNLLGTLNLLEWCRRRQAGLVLLSTSRVYSISALSGLPLRVCRQRFVPTLAALRRPGMTPGGLTEAFSSNPPISLYGASKLAAEILVQEYGAAFKLPVIVNRCGVMAGAGQFGRSDQGVFSFWVHACRRGQPPRFIGFGGKGYQVRDCLHPYDLARLLALQMRRPPSTLTPWNVSGGLPNSMSLAELHAWCRGRYKLPPARPQPDKRVFDVPWLVLNSRPARRQWHWRPEISIRAILHEIADHADRHPDWLELAGT